MCVWGFLTDDPAFLPACCLVACNWQLLGRSVSFCAELHFQKRDGSLTDLILCVNRSRAMYVALHAFCCE